MAVTKPSGDNGVLEFQYYQPPNRTKWESFKNSLYDKESNLYLGRTPKGWGQLLLFYSIFYIVLAAMFAICMQGLFASLDKKAPTYQMERSLIGINPGLGFRPISDDTVEGSLIWYNITNTTTINKWVNLSNGFLAPYRLNQKGENVVNCNFNKPPQEGKVCSTGMEQFGNCDDKNFYGYHTATPCIFLKLNRIYGWKPVYYNHTTEDMPDDLVKRINEIKDPKEFEQIWVTCNGVGSIDKENARNFTYNPPGFAGYYYPFKNQNNYLSPIVAVKVLNLRTNVIVNIECRAWAKNIIYRGGTLNRAGSVTFELQVDSEYQSSPKILTIDQESTPKPTETTVAHDVSSAKSENDTSAPTTASAHV